MTTGGTRNELEALIKRAVAKDAIKDYNAAAELYSEATEIQAKLNGELSLENADLLFAYGKALYNVAISKSDVLGSKVAGKAQTQPEPAAPKAAPVAENLIKDAVSTGAAKRETKSRGAELGNSQNKSYFQFTGDERVVVRVEILNIFPFTSDSKRMGIICRFIRNATQNRYETGEIVFFQKGADTVMTSIVASNDWLDEETGNMAREGLRTLVIGRKSMSAQQYAAFNAAYSAASLSLPASTNSKAETHD